MILTIALIIALISTAIYAGSMSKIVKAQASLIEHLRSEVEKSTEVNDKPVKVNRVKMMAYLNCCNKTLGDFKITGRPVYDCINDMREAFGLDRIEVDYREELSRYEEAFKS